MYPELIHIPAVAIGNEVPTGSTTQPTSLVDVHQTIAAKSEINLNGDKRGNDLLTKDETDESLAYAESTGCFEFRRQLRDFENQIPKAWDTPHYMLASEDRLLLSDKDGDRVINIETRQELPEDPYLEQRVLEIRNNRRDYSVESDRIKVPDEIQSRLKHLGYK
jgi:arylsulfatase